MINHAKLDLLLTDIQTKSTLEEPPPIPTFPELENEQFLKLVVILEKIFDGRGVKKEGATSDTWAKIFSLAQVALIGANVVTTAGTGARTVGKMADQYDWFQPERTAIIEKLKAEYTSDELLQMLRNGDYSRLDNMWSLIDDPRNINLKRELMQGMLFDEELRKNPETVDWMKAKIIRELQNIEQDQKYDIYEGAYLYLFALREIEDLDFYIDILRMANERSIYVSVYDLLSIDYLLGFADTHPERTVDVLHTIYAYFPSKIHAGWSETIISKILELPVEKQEKFMEILIRDLLVRAVGDETRLYAFYQKYGYLLGEELPFFELRSEELDIEAIEKRIRILQELDRQREKVGNFVNPVSFGFLNSVSINAKWNNDRLLAKEVLEIIIEEGSQSFSWRSIDELKKLEEALEILKVIFEEESEASNIDALLHALDKERSRRG